MKILAIGDVVGAPGRKALKELIPQIIKEEGVGFVVANCENAAGGSGITPELADEILGYKVDVITTGDHIWKKKEIEPYIGTQKRLLRPANYPPLAPGAGSVVVETKTGVKVGVLNLIGRVFMGAIDCPFRVGMDRVGELRAQTKIIIVDMHAEATSEKIAMGYYLEGEVSLVFGTHTHIQTADEKILPGGTAFITDVGMTGPYDSVLGRRKEQIIQRFITGMPLRFEMAEDDVKLCGAIVDVDELTGRAREIKRIQREL